jgi:hypothetical protein
MYNYNNSCGKDFTSLNINLNDPAEPPTSNTFEFCQCFMILLLRANFLVYIFFLIDHSELLTEEIRSDGFLIAQA